MSQAITAIIADDMPLFLDGLAALLKESNVTVIGKARNGKELLECVALQEPDIVITDIEMPVMNGIEATAQLKMLHPDLPVIGLTTFDDEHLVVDMIDAGAKGYLLKSNCTEKLYDAIDLVAEGGFYCCEGTTLRLAKMIHSSKTQLYGHLHYEPADKELEIIRLICQQYVSKEIAAMTKLSQTTVEKYRNKIMLKTGSRNVVGIVLFALEKKIFVLGEK